MTPHLRCGVASLAVLALVCALPWSARAQDQEYAIKVIVIGKSRQPWLRRLLHGSILNHLERHSEGLDILVGDV